MYIDFVRDMCEKGSSNILSYGLLFITYQKSGDRWAKAFNTKIKIYSLITVIKRVVADAWVGWSLNPFFTLPLCRGDTLQHP